VPPFLTVNVLVQWTDFGADDEPFVHRLRCTAAHLGQSYAVIAVEIRIERLHSLYA
jgi:hypothetical protein